MAPLLDCSMLAAGLGLGLVAGLGLAGLTSTLVAALHVGSERLLAGFDALSGVCRARAPEKLRDSMRCLGSHTLELLRSRRIIISWEFIGIPWNYSTGA